MKAAPADDVFAPEAKAPLGTLVSYGEDDELDVSALETFDFKKADIAIFATTKEQGKRFIKKATGAGCRVIDLSGATFGDSSVPLVIPELNGELLKRGNGAGCECDEHCECGEECACGENGGRGHCGCGCGTENGRAADGRRRLSACRRRRCIRFCCRWRESLKNTSLSGWW